MWRKTGGVLAACREAWGLQPAPDSGASHRRRLAMSGLQLEDLLGHDTMSSASGSPDGPVSKPNGANDAQRVWPDDDQGNAKKKKVRRQWTREERAEHAVIEKHRREVLNDKFDVSLRPILDVAIATDTGNAPGTRLEHPELGRREQDKALETTNRYRSDRAHRPGKGSLVTRRACDSVPHR